MDKKNDIPDNYHYLIQQLELSGLQAEVFDFNPGGTDRLPLWSYTKISQNLEI
jgi:hypothetical protein